MILLCTYLLKKPDGESTAGYHCQLRMYYMSIENVLYVNWGCIICSGRDKMKEIDK